MTSDCDDPTEYVVVADARLEGVHAALNVIGKIQVPIGADRAGAAVGESAGDELESPNLLVETTPVHACRDALVLRMRVTVAALHADVRHVEPLGPTTLTARVDVCHVRSWARPDFRWKSSKVAEHVAGVGLDEFDCRVSGHDE